MSLSLTACTVAALSLLQQQPVTVPAFDAEPASVAFTPDGSVAYVATYSGNTVAVINTATNSVTHAIPVEGAPFWVALSPDGSKAYDSLRSLACRAEG